MPIHRQLRQVPIYRDAPRYIGAGWNGIGIRHPIEGGEIPAGQPIIQIGTTSGHRSEKKVKPQRKVLSFTKV